MFSKSLLLFRQLKNDKAVSNSKVLMEHCVDQVDGLKDCSKGDAKVAAHSKGVYV